MSCYELGRCGHSQSKRNQTEYPSATFKSTTNTKRPLKKFGQTYFTNIKKLESIGKEGFSPMLDPTTKEGQVLCNNRKRQRINGKAIIR